MDVGHRRDYAGSKRTSMTAPVKLCFSRILSCSSFSVSFGMVMRPLLIHPRVKDLPTAEEINSVHTNLQNLFRVHLEPPPNQLRQLNAVTLLQHRLKAKRLSQRHPKIPLLTDATRLPAITCTEQRLTISST
jgi:hypothetical protein